MPRPSVPLTAAHRRTLARAVADSGGQNQLAERLGVSQAQISLVLSGNKNPSPGLLKRLCAAVGYRVTVRTVVEIEPK